MSRTTRTRWDGATIRDGQWGRRCYDPHCDFCYPESRHGAKKRARRFGKWLIREQLQDFPTGG